jgi:bifunctional DNA-binding transcriptional regulator/antitoxin component of YhaV-PrlF toxin-antitoxin module
VRSTATITAIGQAALPKGVRDQLDGRVIEFIAEGGRIEIRSVASVAGSLSAFARPEASIEELRQAVWGNGAGS